MPYAICVFTFLPFFLEKTEDLKSSKNFTNKRSFKIGTVVGRIYDNHVEIFNVDIEVFAKVLAFF